MSKLHAEDLIANPGYELLAEVDHREIKAFIKQQMLPSVKLIRFYSIYQLVMILLFVLLLGRAAVLACQGVPERIWQLAYAGLFSVTVLVVLHELIHALTYWLCGVRKLKAGAILKKFIFYVAADREVIGYSTFRLVAWAPFVVVKLVCLALGLLFLDSPLAWFFFGTMCIHSLFCAGDIAMLAFYRIHHDKTIYNFDDLEKGKTFFYVEKKTAE